MLPIDFSAATLVKVAVGYVIFSFVANIVGGIAIIAMLSTGTCS